MKEGSIEEIAFKESINFFPFLLTWKIRIQIQILDRKLNSLIELHTSSHPARSFLQVNKPLCLVYR